MKGLMSSNNPIIKKNNKKCNNEHLERKCEMQGKFYILKFLFQVKLYVKKARDLVSWHV